MDLAGCINDAKDWQALLEGRGYTVQRLHDAEATRARVVDGLKTLIGRAGDGDSLVFTFSGHGSWLPDDDRDEPDQRDEMMCPYDVMQEQYLLDDDLNEIFQKKVAGARLYVIADSCHSGSVVRYAPLPAQPDVAPIKARFLPPYVFAREIGCSSARSIARSIRRRRPSSVSGAAVCRMPGQEFSYDTSFKGRPNGAFTRTAIDALQDAGITSPQAFYEAIRQHLPSQTLPQTPQLFGSRRPRRGRFLNGQRTGHRQIGRMGGAVLPLRPLQPSRASRIRSSPRSRTCERSPDRAMSAAVYLDLESGAQRIASVPARSPKPSFSAPSTAAIRETLEQFLPGPSTRVRPAATCW